jgi:predicted nucleic acid-binding protein
MHILLDTGVLLRLVNQQDPLHAATRSAVQTLFRRGDTLATSPQNIAEFWNVSTRPAQARGGFGRTPAETERCVRFFEKFGIVIPDQPAGYAEWKRLVIGFGVHGKAVHDARIVAAMLVANVSTLLTFNVQDFLRYQNLLVLTPQDVVAGRTPTA